MNAIIILLFLAFLVYLFERDHHDYIFWAVLVFFMIFPLTNSKSEKEVETLRKEIQKKDKEIEGLRSSIKADTSLEKTQTSTKVTVEKQESVVGKEDWEKSKSW